MNTNKKKKEVIPVTGDEIYDEFLATSGVAGLYASPNKSRQPASSKNRQSVSDKNKKPIPEPKTTIAQAAKRKTGKAKKEKQLPKSVSDKASPTKKAADSFDNLWQVAAASKAKKPKDSQVWLDTDLYRKIERFNVCRGKPVPTKHVINAILQMYLNDHKIETTKFGI